MQIEDKELEAARGFFMYGQCNQMSKDYGRFLLSTIEGLKSYAKDMEADYQSVNEQNMKLRNEIRQYESKVEGLKGEVERLKTAKSIEEWHEDMGDVLWWKFLIEEPPYCGTPLDSDWPDYHTHWTPIITPSLEVSHENT